MARDTADNRRRAAGRTCAYCGQKRLDGRQRPEHPIPRVIGSRLTVFTVCDGCNHEAGRQVDAPWLRNVFVQTARAEAGVVDPRHKGRASVHPLLNGVFKDEDGHTVVAEDGVPRYPGSIVHDEDGVSIAADSPERAQELLRRLRRQLADEGQAPADSSQEIRSEHRPWLSRQESISIADGVRMGAKLGLAFAAEAYDEEWRESLEARRLREWLWSDKPRNAGGNLLAWVPNSSEEHPFASPPDHAAFFSPISGATALIVLVFGKLPFAIPVAPEGHQQQTAWRIRLEALPERTTFDELLLTAAKRYERP